jgi:predicted O-methyltransferase YrrM
MGTDLLAGELIQTLISSKINGDFLELGTVMGISTAWMLNGMDEESKLTSIDNNPELIEIVSNVLGNDSRLELITENGSVWIKEYDGA